ncbi:MAG: hypothetical protein DCF25_01630 [Leptolyngbya foveolarum]|uniref:Prepilin-type cleavage/methylation domain-containing protein n=1 Tax=Leptolyngbya foveolarum TaxID=47253 RepID=A0A2W4WKQ7_9CYAN|nr:MAG: hypothetical protein DCF25_01630 [Leptolyngbya foveolarum]
MPTVFTLKPKLKPVTCLVLDLIPQCEKEQMNRYQKSFISQVGRTANADGLTLIECLVAIAMIGVTTGVMAPVMVFSMATRVQSQRAEQALQVAKAEVDQVRLSIERGSYASLIATYPVTSTAITATPAPNSTAVSLDSTMTTDVAKLINIDDDAEYEFAAQIFRTQGSSSSPTKAAFELGVRVYDLAAVQRAQAQGIALRADSTARLNFTSGDGQRGSRPLAVIYTSIFKGDKDGALCEYWKYVSKPTDSTAGIEDCL